MLCECGEREATIHEVVIQNGKKIERHLCEQCASQLGVTADPNVPISELVSKYIQGQKMSVPKVGSKDGALKPNSAQASRPETSAGCPDCGMSFAAFKKHGILGCQSCYEHNIARLGPLIARAHDGAEQHIGKVPKRSLQELHGSTDPTKLAALLGNPSEREERLSSIRTKLSNAIEHEDYEQAALLRDELTRVASLPSAQIEPSAPSTTTQSAPHKSSEQ